MYQNIVFLLSVYFYESIYHVGYLIVFHHYIFISFLLYFSQIHNKNQDPQAINHHKVFLTVQTVQWLSSCWLYWYLSSHLLFSRDSSSPVLDCQQRLLPNMLLIISLLRKSKRSQRILWLVIRKENVFFLLIITHTVFRKKDIWVNVCSVSGITSQF